MVELGLTLDQLESLALEHNPTIRQSSASVYKGTALRSQVGMRPNPTAGYQGSQLADAGTDQHLLFVEQEFVTGKKLEWNRTVLDRGVQAQLWDVETRRYRVLTDIRRLFYEALAAQRRMELTDNFHELLVKGVEIARLRKEALEGSQTEVLQAQIQLKEIDLARQRAELAFRGAWNDLAATAGIPDLACRPLVGTLPEDRPVRDWCAELARLWGASPELQAARAKAQQALANLSRQEVQAIPNVTMQLAAGVDNGTNSGMLNLQVQAPIPVFNDNSGNISAASAEYCRATHEVRRIEMGIQSRLARTAQEYDSALAAVTMYRTEILPRSEQTLTLAETAYQAGEMDFLQVLVVRRTYFEANLAYVDALRELARADASVQGLLLTGGLDSPDDFNGDTGLRDQTFSQQ